MRIRPRVFVAGALATVAAATGGWLTLAQGHSNPSLGDDGPATATPIKHVVVIFGENESYDHYFGTYPNASNADASEPKFYAQGTTPASNNYVAHPDLLTANPNKAQPKRFTRAQAHGCGNNHDYGPEQKSFNGGKMDKFVENTGGGCGNDTMNYFDGNTVTALWNLAQHYTMSDNFFGTTFGPSTPGAINLISGNTHGANKNDTDGTGTITADPDPVDDCGNGAGTVMSGQNVGDLLNAKNVTWGWFQGGFKPTTSAADNAGKAICGAAHNNIAGGGVPDYSAHHEPFMYYVSTGNPDHLPPTSTAMIGHSDQANHQYDVSDFQTALAAGNMPQVSFLKAPAYQDGHPGNSDPVDEQDFIVKIVNLIQSSPEWDSTAIMLAYDDSDGWYDHAYAGDAAINPSKAASDGLNGTGVCGTTDPAPGAYQDRCGPGPRLPFLIVSPWVSPNTIHHTLREQTSITKFIEDNWSLGRIGDQSFDERAATLDSMFDFDTTHSRAAKVTLNANGQAPGSDTPPPAATTPTPAPSAAPTAAPTVAPTATPTPIGSFKPKVTVSAKLSKGKLTLTLKETGVTTKGTIKVKLSVLKGKKTVGTGSGTVKSGKVAIKVKPGKKVKFGKGSYSLKLTVTQGKSKKNLTAKFKLK